jgi:hypothetical protein
MRIDRTWPTRRSVLRGGTALMCSSAVLPKTYVKNDNINVLQTDTASINRTALPPSTGQIIPRALAEEIIATNRKLAPNFGYRLEHDGSFTDPATAISIRQEFVPAAPHYIIPAYTAPKHLEPSPVRPALVSRGAFRLFARGQSLAANNGYER